MHCRHTPAQRLVIWRGRPRLAAAASCMQDPWTPQLIALQLVQRPAPTHQLHSNTGPALESASSKCPTQAQTPNPAPPTPTPRPDPHTCVVLRSVGIVRNECAGLCRPIQDMMALHQQPQCTKPLGPNHKLAYHPSHPDHAAFEKMWV
jgi:hypothetical protein